MLSEKAEKILDIILKECNGKYKILNAEDFQPTTRYADALSELENLGYITIRYSDGEEYLLAPTYKAEGYFSEKQDAYYSHAVLCEKVCKSALTGAAVGGALAALISFLLGALCFG